MRTGTLMLGAVAAGLTALAVSTQATGDEPATGAAPDIQVEHFIGRVILVNGPETSLVVDDGEGIMKSPTIRETRTRYTVEGHGKRGPRNCRKRNGSLQMTWDGKMHPLEAFPTLTITAPDAISLAIELEGGEIDIANTSNLTLDFDGCGDGVIGDVADTLTVRIDGSADLSGGRASELDARIYGSGDMELGAITGYADLEIDGSGDMEFDSVGGGMDLKIDGSGDVSLGAIFGPVDIDINGSGDVEMDGGYASNLSIRIDGSGDVHMDGDVDAVSVLLKGSGGVYVARSNGIPDVRRSGSGDVQIGGRSYGHD